jgi:hypothetical protein
MSILPPSSRQIEVFRNTIRHHYPQKINLNFIDNSLNFFFKEMSLYLARFFTTFFISLSTMPWRYIGGGWTYSSTQFDLGTRWRWLVNSTARPLYSQGKSLLYPLDRRLGGPQRLSLTLPYLTLRYFCLSFFTSLNKKGSFFTLFNLFSSVSFCKLFISIYYMES